ncbi:septum formation family protein [Glaciibacter sp. 2TAF33]|uniref:septum formation family protein n=1 Tax=Glaciibacter sp. 2TAF33 TaxID=3233015 RepID=UPI003F8ED77D
MPGPQLTQRPAPAWRALTCTVMIASAVLVLSGCSADHVPDAPFPSAQPAASAALLAPLAVGDCVNGSADTLLRDLTQVKCEEGHDYEVYSAFDMPTTAYPGDDAVTAAAESECASVFESFVGVPYPRSALDYAALTPDAAEWDGGDRRAVCLVGDPAGPVAGSLAGIRR